MTYFSNVTLTQRFGTCSKDCYGSCSFVGYWNDLASVKKFVNAKPEKNHPLTRGFFCAKLSDRKQLLYHPERLKNSLIRTGKKGFNQFKNINNEDALNIIAEKLGEVLELFGTQAIIGTFNAGNYGLISRYAPLRFFKKLGATITTGGICNEGGCVALSQLFGTYSITNPLQLINEATELIVVWGSNLSDKNNHAYALIKQAQKKGVKIVVVDSRYTQIAQDADLFISIIPGTDHFIALAVCKYLLKHDLHNHLFLQNYAEGYEFLFNRVMKFEEKKVIKTLKISSNILKEFIDLLIKHQNHTIFNIGYGVQKDFYGGKIVQIIALIQILLGNLCKKGTGIIYSQSDFNRDTLLPVLEYITSITLSDSINEISLIDLGKILASDKYKMIFIYNFNPVSSLPNQNLTKENFSREDLFVVVQDLFLNETTKYADIVVPSKFDLESFDIVSPYYLPSISVNYGGPCPYPNCLSNFEFYKRLSEKLSWKTEWNLKEDDGLILNNCINLLPNDFKRDIKAKGYHILFEENDIPFKDFLFPTLSKKINLNNIGMDFGFDRLRFIGKRKRNEFFLITPSHKYFIHSQLGQLRSEYLESFKKVYISKDNIDLLKFEDGMKVLVQNEYGKGEFFLEGVSFLNKFIALIYSGSPGNFEDNSNANIFTPDIPESMGRSGAYNSAVVQISDVYGS